jgi:hypothetical protein
MRAVTPFLASAAALLLAGPASAQGGPVTMGHFMKVEPENVMAFEEATREHMAWHADRNDPWAWPVYQAMTGEGLEYAGLTPNHSWADFDDPPVPMDEDMAHWLDIGGDLVASIEASAWVSMEEVSNPPTGAAPPIVQVYEWEITGNEEALMHIIQMYKEAVDEMGLDFPFGWSRVVSNEGPPRIFIAIWFNSFAELDQAGPGPMQIMAEVHGEYATRNAAEAAAAAWRSVGSRIWVLRPDLSYLPSM